MSRVSLRARLVAGLFVLMSVGLAIFGVTMYELYSGSQYRQLGTDLKNAVPLVTQELADKAGIELPQPNTTGKPSFGYAPNSSYSPSSDDNSSSAYRPNNSDGYSESASYGPGAETVRQPWRRERDNAGRRR